MFGDFFYHSLLQKYVAIFGSLFNEITVKRFDGDDAVNDDQFFRVPLSYGPREKYLAMTQQKPEGKVQAIILPRMSFEINNIEPDTTRKYIRTNQYRTAGSNNTMFEPVPYNISFSLNIMTKSQVDGLQIIEQIMPYFNPDWTVSAQLIQGDERLWDIPIVMDGGPQTQEVYEGNFEERRLIVWTINFHLKGWFHGPIKPRKVIKFITVNTFGTTNIEDPGSSQTFTIQPGLTANGQPTTDSNQSIAYNLIEEGDDWAYIVKSFENE